MGAVPVLDGARDLLRRGFVTGASARNWASYGDRVEGAPSPEDQALLTDPQTSGGLLVACAPEAAQQMLECFRSHGFASASIVGHVEPDSAPVLRLAGTGGAA